jgi:hypothetical protein
MYTDINTSGGSSSVNYWYFTDTNMDTIFPYSNLNLLTIGVPSVTIN